MGKANQYCCYSLGQLYQCSALLPDCEASHCLEHVSAAMATAEQLQSLTATGTTRYVWRLSSGSFRCPGGGSGLEGGFITSNLWQSSLNTASRRYTGPRTKDILQGVMIEGIEDGSIYRTT